VDLLYTAIWSLALANVVGAGLCIFLSRPFSRITVIPFHYVAPFMVLIITLVSYQATRNFGDFIALFLIGALGWLMKHQEWPRPAALIGFVLTGNLETYLFITIQRYGFNWITRPGVILLALIITASIIFSVINRNKSRSGGKNHAK
jgi:TctA family transporter